MGFKFKCAWCGEIVDLDTEQANWYENQKEFVNDSGELEVWAKVQHISKKRHPKFLEHPACDEVNYLIFKGKLEQVIKREH
jgi:hypothetical protein